jgi:hypothetical protein
MIDSILHILSNRISLIPIAYRGKRPVFKWEYFQSNLPMESQVRSWFTRPHNVAIIGGQVSGGLVIFDFDEDAERMFDKFSSLVDLTGFPVVATGGGGIHIYMRTHEPIGNKKLARRSDGKVYIESRGEGGYAIAPPSVHPSGIEYKFLSGGFDSIPVLSQDRFDVMLDAADSLDEIEKTISDYQPIRSDVILDNSVLRRYALGTLRSICGGLSSVVSGGRNNELNIAAFVLGRYAGASLLDRGEVHDRLLQACTTNRLISDDGRPSFEKTFNSGFSAGQGLPIDKAELSGRLAPRQEEAVEREGQVGEPDWNMDWQKSIIFARSKHG